MPNFSQTVNAEIANALKAEWSFDRRQPGNEWDLTQVITLLFCSHLVNLLTFCKKFHSVSDLFLSIYP